MKKNRIFSVVSALCLAVTMTGVMPEVMQTEVTAATSTASKAVSVKLNEKNLKPLGRAYFNNNMVYCSLSGSGAEFTFTGKKCQITLTGDYNSAKSKDNLARVAIYVNGKRVVDDLVNKEKETYTVFNSKKEQTVDVKIVKISEAPNSTFAISKIVVDGNKIKPAKEKKHYIEFIGDSITCGYGVDDENKAHHFATDTEDVTKTYAYRTAKDLDADYSMVSYSGYGIISGYCDGKNKNTASTIQQYYDKVGNTWAGMKDFIPQDTEWDFSKHKPDAIVINLGTNDASYTKGQQDRCEEFQAAYVEFIKTVREKNPDAAIFCTLGIMGQDLCPYVEAAANQYKNETGDSNVYYMAFDVQNYADGYAADWHPTAKTHKKASEKLVSEIKKVLKW